MSRKFGTLAAGLSVAAAMTLPSAAQAQGGSLLAEPFVNRDAKAFAPVGKNFEHWLTSARCPTQMGDMPLIRISQFYIQGHSVNCRYVLEGNSKIDFNIRTFDRDETLTSAMEGLVGRFQLGSKVAKVGETQQASSGWRQSNHHWVRGTQSSLYEKPNKKPRRIVSTGAF